MANKEKIDYLLLDIRELEKLIAGMRDADLYPVSFFSQTFELSHKIINDLHSLETNQVELLRKQMEEHQKLIQSIPFREAAEQPAVTSPQPEVPEVKEVESPISEPQKIEVPMEQPETAKQPIVEKRATPEEAIQKETVAQTTSKAGIPEKAAVSLNEILEKQNLSDFRKAFSLNDRFRFRRELFGGDEARMNKAITELNEIHTYEESMSYLHNELNWNIEDPAVTDFIKLLEKRFL